MENKFPILGGTVCCESFHFRGREKGHQLRSDRVRVSDQYVGIGCIYCGVVLPTTIDTLVNESGKRSFPIDQSTAHEYRFHFNYGPDYLPSEVNAVVVFDRFEQFDLEADVNIGRDFDASEFASLPASLAKIGNKLAALGYRVVGPVDLEEFHRHGYRNVTMVRGVRPVPGKPFIDGVRVALTYIV